MSGRTSFAEMVVAEGESGWWFRYFGMKATSASPQQAA